VPGHICLLEEEPGAPSLPAIDKAAQPARAFGASVDLYHSITQKVRPGRSAPDAGI
jgi:hypothetical protein